MPPTPTKLSKDTEELLAKLRHMVGVPLSAELSPDQVLEAVDEALAEGATDQAGQFELPAGVVLVDETIFAELKSDAARARSQQSVDLVAAAVKSGRIPPVQAQSWRALIQVDPTAAQKLADLPTGAVPMAPAGFTGGVEESSDDDRTYEALYGAGKEA